VDLLLLRIYTRDERKGFFLSFLFLDSVLVLVHDFASI
jgi:hypothetical protein